jgi:ribonuclease HI
MSDYTKDREAARLLTQLSGRDAARMISEFLGDMDAPRASELLAWAADRLEAAIPKDHAGTSETAGTVFTAYIDGASLGNPGPSGIGGIILDENGGELERFSEYIGNATNNVAEYRALIHVLDRLSALGAGHVRILTDSQLLQRQTTGEWKIKDEKLRELNREIRSGIRRFASFEITHVGREKNRTADRLAKRGAEG